MLPHVWITFLLNKLVSLLYNTGLIRFFSSNETHVYKNQKNVLNQTMGGSKTFFLALAFLYLLQINVQNHQIHSKTC